MEIIFICNFGHLGSHQCSIDEKIHGDANKKCNGVFYKCQQPMCALKAKTPPLL